ncbi:MAG: hypothetical protein K6G12_11540 [Lachnospiraceae bacterium]|nr:hypothetical protein [Lachnospiraceae bacterium]
MSYDPIYNCIFTGLIALILGSLLFSYLHSFGRIDLYHSMPITVKRLFGIRYLIGACSFFTACVIAVLISNDDINKVILTFLFFLTAYHVTIYAYTITGNPVVAICVSIIIFFYIDLWERIYELMCSYETVSSFFAEPMPEISVMDIYINESGEPFWLLLVKLMIWALITFLFCRNSYIKRPAEACTNLIAFYSSNLLLKLMIVVPVSLLMGKSAYDSFSGHKNTVQMVWMILTAIVTSVIIETLLSRKFKTAIKKWGSIIFALIIIFAFYAGFKYSATKYNEYVPSADRIESYAVYNPLDSYYYYNNIDFNEDGSVNDYISAPEYVKAHMFLADTEAIVKLAAKSVKTDYHDMASPLPLQVYYRLDDGRTKSRLIWVDMDAEQNRAYLNRIVGPAYYKSGIWQAFTSNIPKNANVSAVRYLDFSSDRYSDIGSDMDKANIIVKQWRSAMVLYDYDHVRYDVAVGEIEVVFDDGAYRWIMPVYDDMLSKIKGLRYN